MSASGIVNNPTVEKTFLGMLADLGFTTSLDVKMAMRTLDPNGKYYQADISEELKELSNKYDVYNSIKTKNGNFYVQYETNNQEKFKKHLEEVISFEKFVLDKLTGINFKGLADEEKDYFSNNTSSTTDSNVSINVIPQKSKWYCGEYNSTKNAEIIVATDRNSARAKWATENNVLYRNVYANKVK